MVFVANVCHAQPSTFSNTHEIDYVVSRDEKATCKMVKYSLLTAEREKSYKGDTLLNSQEFPIFIFLLYYRKSLEVE